MGDFIQHNSSHCNFTSNNSWVVLSSIEQSIKHKIEAVGTPLKDWNIQINYGIKTGCNEAFIINRNKREEILNACITEDERIATNELIRPILRGRDIKRYGYDFADLWLINTHNGVKENRINRIDINNFPAIKSHLDSFWNKIEKRTDQGDTPYNLRNCAYMDLFFQRKICWKAIGRNLAFSLVPKDVYLTAPASFISAKDNDNYILAYLCSNYCKYYIYKYSDTTGAGDIMLNIQSLIKIPIPKLIDQNIVHLISQLLSNTNNYHQMTFLSKEIDKCIYKQFNFCQDEIDYIENVI